MRRRSGAWGALATATVTLVLAAPRSTRAEGPPLDLAAPAPPLEAAAPPPTTQSLAPSPSPSPPQSLPPAPAPSMPTPGSSPRSAPEDWRQAPRHRIAVLPHYAYRFASSTGRRVTPRSGFGISGTLEMVYLRLSPILDAAFGIDFSHDRFATSETGAVMRGEDIRTFRTPRVTSETSFVLVHTAATRRGRVRPYLTLGVGIGLGYFDSAAIDLRPGTARATHALGRIALGSDIHLNHEWSISFRAEYTALRGTTSIVVDSGETVALFGDLLALCAGVAYRF